MRDLLRSVWDEPRAANPPPAGWRDGLLVAAAVLVAVLEGLARTDLPGRWPWVLVAVAVAPTLLWRRRRPLLAVVVAFGVTEAAALLVGQDTELFATGFMIVLPYALFRWGAGREIVLGSTLVLLAAARSMLTGGLVVADLVGGSAVLAATAALGLAVRAQAGARARELDRARLLERERLARDLHDTVAHHVSAMAIRAQAGLAGSAQRPEAATDALRVIEGEASRTLAEMRDMVVLLRRDGHADREPAPRVADVARLAAPAGDGPRVDVAISGDVDDLAPPIATAVYRLAQEAVTNARRHARHATRVEVRVSADDTAVHVRVSDDGDPPAARAGRGYGLVGMTERVGLLGGRCDAGPGPDRGWTVTAVLPRRGAAT